MITELEANIERTFCMVTYEDIDEYLTKEEMNKLIELHLKIFESKLKKNIPNDEVKEMIKMVQKGGESV